MALGALISAYHDADGGGVGAELRATLPLAGRTLVEYQARLATAAGAAPVVVLVERMPAALIAAVDRLLGEGIRVRLARTAGEAAACFADDDRVLLVAGGLYADAASVDRVAGAGGPAILTVADNIGLDAFERIDVASRWAGLAMASGAQIGATAAMLGDWDLQSTLLRRLVQDNARQLAAPVGPDAPLLLLATGRADLEDAERRIFAGSRSVRADWVERRVTPLLEEFAVERLMRTGVEPRWLIAGALGLTLLASSFFVMRWPAAAMVALLVSVPLDSIAERLAALRMQPLAKAAGFRVILAVAGGAAFAGLGIYCMREGAGWGALATAAAGLAFFAACVAERPTGSRPSWLASRKGVIIAAIPFALAGLWTTALAATALWAAGSFFVLQRLTHGGTREKGLAAP